MINLTVVNIKEIIKSLVKLIILILIIIVCTRLFSSFKDVNIDIRKYVKDKINSIDGKTFIEYMNENISLFRLKTIDEKEHNNKEESVSNNLEVSNIFTYVKNISSYTVSLAEKIEMIDIKKGNEKSIIKDDIDYRISEKDKNKVKTKVISENNLEEVHNFKYKSVKIRNESKYDLSKIDFSKNIKLKNKKDIIIYHTHTCESYTQTKKNTYKASGRFRTLDKKYSVVKVGDVLSKYLRNNNFNVIHNTTYHDYPKYNGSYNRSLNTISKIMKTSNAGLVIDLHRDAVASSSNYAPTVEINGKKVSQLMFVIGTDGGNLTHKNWKKNLRFAVKIQEKANKMYPGLFRPIIVRNSRYNQHIAEAGCIIEVGATGNTLEESIGAMKYLSIVISEVLNDK